MVNNSSLLNLNHRNINEVLILYFMFIALKQIRDSAYARGELNATTSLLMTCKSQVIYPYFYVLSLVCSYFVNKENGESMQLWSIKDTSILFVPVHKEWTIREFESRL